MGEKELRMIERATKALDASVEGGSNMVIVTTQTDYEGLAMDISSSPKPISNDFVTQGIRSICRTASTSRTRYDRSIVV